MNQAQMKNGEWVLLESKTDGYYHNGKKVCNPYAENLHQDYKQVIIFN